MGFGKNKCLDCNKPYVFSKGLCQYCWKIKFGKPIKKVSASMQKTLDEYKPERKEFLEANPFCQVRLEGCTNYSTCIHHMKSKYSKELYLDKKFWMASCIKCNGRIEEIGAKAYELGLKIKHNSKD